MNKNAMITLSATFVIGAIALLPGRMAAADTITFSDTTMGSPLWARAIANPDGSFGGTSAVATAVPYNVTSFFVSTSGNYDFLSTSVAPAGWDNYLFLYRTAFSAAAPASNYVVGNDDFPSEGLAGFDNVNLQAESEYYLVTTGFFNQDSGAFSNRISGPGAITIGSVAVPEPSTALLVCPALLWAAVRLRKRFAA